MQAAKVTLRTAGIIICALLALFGSGCHRDETSRASPVAYAAWKGEIVYQVMVDRFFDGDGSNNASKVQGALRYRGGDLKGLIAKLDYIKDLGATAILLNPVVAGAAYHGYAVTDPFNIDPHYGTLDDYRELVRQSHARGLKIIFDLVLNHVSPKSEVFLQHPEWFRPGTAPAALNDSLNDDIWAKASFYGLPDFNHENEPAYQYLLSVANFWIGTGIDGFRFDAVTLSTPQFWKRFVEDVRKKVPDKFLLLGEIFTTDQRRLNRYIGSFNAFFDFPLYKAISDVLLHGDHPALLHSILSLDALYSHRDVLQFTFLDNHDVSRLVSSRAPLALERLKLGLAFLLTRRGVPTILYGTEVGLADDPTLADQDWDRSRSSMSFDNNQSHTVFRHLKQLIALRKEYKFGESPRYDIVDHSLPGLWVTVYEAPRGHFVVSIFNFSSVPRTQATFRLTEPAGLRADALLKPLITEGPAIEMITNLVSFDIGPYESNFYSVQPAE